MKRVALDYISAYEKRFGTKPATFGANTWDAGLILQRAIPVALKKGKPGTEAFRVALRDAIEQEHEVVGCQGVFNMSPTNHNGMDERARRPRQRAPSGRARSAIRVAAIVVSSCSPVGSPTPTAKPPSKSPERVEVEAL